jgi:CubicO group peptidase (beta-lactamase class C family)
MTRLEPGSAEEVGMSAERLGWARAMMQRHVESGCTPATAAVVARRGKIVLAESFGMQRPEGAPLDLDHIWAIASAGKPLTAAVLLSLVEEGRVGITDPVVDYVPELADAGTGGGNEEVLIHHLLTHTSGWESAQRTHRLEALAMSGELPPSPEGRDFLSHMFMHLALDPIRVAAPGEQMDYDNSHLTLVSEIIRRVTGGTLDAAMRQRVFDPLGMARSAVIVDASQSSHVVRRPNGLPFGPDGLVPFEGDEFESSDSGAAGIHASPVDLAVFGQMILDAGSYDGVRVLAPSTVRSMVTNQIPGTPALFGDRVLPEASWGYAFTVIHERPFPFFCGGLLPPGSVAHPGAGGISYWIDFDNEIVGVFFELISEMTEFLEPVSGIGHRFQDVITGAVVS